MTSREIEIVPSDSDVLSKLGVDREVRYDQRLEDNSSLLYEIASKMKSGDPVILVSDNSTNISRFLGTGEIPEHCKFLFSSSVSEKFCDAGQPLEYYLNILSRQFGMWKELTLTKIHVVFPNDSFAYTFPGRNDTNIDMVHQNDKDKRKSDELHRDEIRSGKKAGRRMAAIALAVGAVLGGAAGVVGERAASPDPVVISPEQPRFSSLSADAGSDAPVLDQVPPSQNKTKPTPPVRKSGK